MAAILRSGESPREQATCGQRTASGLGGRNMTLGKAVNAPSGDLRLSRRNESRLTTCTCTRRTCDRGNQGVGTAVPCLRSFCPSRGQRRSFGSNLLLLDRQLVPRSGTSASLGRSWVCPGSVVGSSLGRISHAELQQTAHILPHMINSRGPDEEAGLTAWMRRQHSPFKDSLAGGSVW